MFFSPWNLSDWEICLSNKRNEKYREACRPTYKYLLVIFVDELDILTYGRNVYNKRTLFIIKKISILKILSILIFIKSISFSGYRSNFVYAMRTITVIILCMFNILYFSIGIKIIIK